MPVVVSIWLSTVSSLPVVELGRAGAVVGGDRQCRARTHPLHAPSGNLSSGNVKMTEIGCSWVIDDDAVGIAGLHVIAGIDLAQPDPPGDRRDDAAIGQVELLRVDLRLVGLHRRLVLRDQRDLRVAGLLRDRVLRDQRVVALQVELGVFQQRLVLGQLRLAWASAT